jgi:hypothetical protein
VDGTLPFPLPLSGTPIFVFCCLNIFLHEFIELKIPAGT